MQTAFVVRLGRRKWRQVTASLRALATRQSVAFLVLFLCSISLLSQLKEDARVAQTKIDVKKLWNPPPSTGWRPSSAVRTGNWPDPPKRTNGYLVVRCNGGLNQQRSAICNAVLAARIMNATLVLPELDTNSYWHDHSGFSGMYDVRQFMGALQHDVRIVHKLPRTAVLGKKRKALKAYQLRPPRDAQPSWYETEALEKMKEFGAVYLTPFSHRLAEALDNHEYQRLRCRVNFHALRFREEVMQLSSAIVQRLRSEGRYIAIHLRFEMDMLAFAGCLDIFTAEEQKILRDYRKRNFADKRLESKERRLMGKCPLTPEEVGLILRAMGFDNSTRIYLAVGEVFGGERFMKPLREMFPNLESRSTVATAQELAAVSAEGRGLLGPAVDYIVCLLSDIFMPTYDGPSNFANNLLGHRQYYGFRTSIRPDRKALAPIFMEREAGWMGTRSFEASVRQVMLDTPLGGPHPRVPPESFYTNSWPECFCQHGASKPEDRCLTTPDTWEEESANVTVKEDDKK